MRSRVALAAVVVFSLVLAGGCGKKKTMPGIASLSAEAAFRRGIDLLSRHQLRQAKTALEGIQFDPDSRAVIEPLTRLALADATFYQGTDLGLIDARNLYLEFVTHYGTHRLAPWAGLIVERERAPTRIVSPSTLTDWPKPPVSAPSSFCSCSQLAPLKRNT